MLSGPHPPRCLGLLPVAGALADAAVAIAVPYAMHPRDWGDVIGSSAVAISDSNAIKQMN